MLRILRDLFDSISPAHAEPNHQGKDSLQFAAAALLVEVARIDGAMQPAERDAVLRAIHENFALDAAEAEALLQAAEAEMQHAGGYYPFTSLINRRFTQPQKEHLIELMWRAAYADDELSAHELHLMRKLAGLLHIADTAYIAAKLRAKEARQGAQR
jgi:uncharacterized tellurite resistance protein B-like protein